MPNNINDAKRSLTFGEKAVGLTFNPSNDSAVERAKLLAAQLIDVVEFKHRSIDGASWMENVLRTAAVNAVIAASSTVVKFLTWKED